MRLSSFTDFGLRALMRAAGEPDRVFTTEEIAAEFNISRNHLAKVVGELANAGFIVTHRGAAGGFRLARAPETIAIGEVARALESPEALVECCRPDGGQCVLTPRCLLKAPLSRAIAAFYRELDNYTLAQCAYDAPGKTDAKRSASKRTRAPANL